MVAALAKELNALTVAVVTKPFGFEGPRRMKQAERGLADLAADRRYCHLDPERPVAGAGSQRYQFLTRRSEWPTMFCGRLCKASRDIITTPGIINRDFSDIRAIMLGMGFAMMGTASAKGENAARRSGAGRRSLPAARRGRREGRAWNPDQHHGSSQLGIHEVNEACALIRAATEYDDVQINFGVVLDEAMRTTVKITVIATGFQRAGHSFGKSNLAEQALERGRASVRDCA